VHLRSYRLRFGLPALIDEDLSIQMADYDEALSRARKAYSESIGAPKIPNVSWDDVGGLARVKAEVLDTIQLPLDHPELFGGGLKKRSGSLHSSC
jgi:peroxin-6